jgi:alcohol dehydrogenase YqhD (iron-dependent ADH family)
LRPVFSVLNPELFSTLPKAQLGYGVADMMSHVFERYFTNTTHTDLTDGLCEATLKTLMKNAPAALKDMRDYDAWSELGFAGTVAHNGSSAWGASRTGPATAWSTSVVRHLRHRARRGAGVLTPGWMRYVYRDNIEMFVQFAVNVMGVDGSFRDPDVLVEEGISRLAAFFARLGLPGSLRDLDIDETRLEEMAKKATGAAFGEERPIGGLKKLRWQDVLAIYRMVL